MSNYWTKEQKEWVAEQVINYMLELSEGDDSDVGPEDHIEVLALCTLRCVENLNLELTEKKVVRPKDG